MTIAGTPAQVRTVGPEPSVGAFAVVGDRDRRLEREHLEVAHLKIGKRVGVDAELVPRVRGEPVAGGVSAMLPVRAIFASQRRRARERLGAGVYACGAITSVQRFGGGCRGSRLRY